MDADDVAAHSRGEAFDMFRIPSGAARVVGSFQQPPCRLEAGGVRFICTPQGGPARPGRGHVIWCPM